MEKTHFGLNIALGGAGNKNPNSGNTVASDGNHGQLYMLHRPSIKNKKTGQKSEASGILAGITQSAYGRPDQNGGTHSILATHHELSATAGKNFGNKNELEGLGSSRYRDGIHLKVTVAQLTDIMRKEIHQPLSTKKMLRETGDPAVRCLPPYPDAESQAKATKVSYQETQLIRYQEKQAGKNKGPFDGFYKPQGENKDEEKSDHYVIKAPSSAELFTERYSNEILSGFKKFISPEYTDSLICSSNVILLPDGTYGLIQPKKEGIKPTWEYFKEQAQKQDQGYAEYSWDKFTSLVSNKNDRNGLYEMLYGQTQYYPLLANFGDINSLAVCLLYSLIIGDFSVHSDNIVYFEKDGKIVFGKIDGGAGLRHIGANMYVMDPAENYHNFLSRYKGYTKAYHRLYEQVPGLYDAVSAQAKILLESCTPEILSDILLQALENTSVDTFLSPEEKLEIADYMEIKEFGAVGKENAATNKLFSDALAKILLQRIDQLANLPPMQAKAAPIAAKRLTPNELVDFAFPMLQQAWQKEAERNLYAEDSDDDEAVAAAAAEEEKKPLPPIEIIRPIGEESVYSMRFPLEVGKESIVLMSPACDAEQSSPDTAGTTPLPDVLAKIREVQKNEKNDTYFVPLAECQAVGGLVARHHWTLLIIRSNRCYFLDPCGSFSLSYVYSLKPLQKMLENYKFELKGYTYLGWQGITDDINCGRFVADMTQKAAQLIYSATPFNNVTTRLAGLQPCPTAETLIHAQAKCRIPAEIESEKAVCEARGQGHLYEVLREAEEKAAEAKRQADALAEAQKQAEEAAAEAQRLAQAAAEAQRQAEEAAAEAKRQAEEAAKLKEEEAAAEAQRQAPEAQRQADALAANKAQTQKIIIGVGILLAGVGALVKFSTLIAISLLTSTIGIALMIGGSMITLYGCCFFNRQNSGDSVANNTQLRPQA